jgi:hypothetical protein
MNNSCYFTKGWTGHFGPKSNPHKKEILNEFFYKLLLNMLGIAILFTNHMIITVENIFIFEQHTSTFLKYQNSKSYQNMFIISWFTFFYCKL